jgi:hypothetical protein
LPSDAPDIIGRVRLVAVAMTLSACLVVAGCGDNDETGFAPPPRETRVQDEPKLSVTKERFKATLNAPTHRPKVRERWRWTVTAETNDGRPLRAKASILFVFAGQVVGRGGDDRFTGARTETIRWPERSAGYPLVFRVALTTSRGKANLDYPVQVRK